MPPARPCCRSRPSSLPATRAPGPTARSGRPSSRTPRRSRSAAGSTAGTGTPSSSRATSWTSRTSRMAGAPSTARAASWPASTRRRRRSGTSCEVFSWWIAFADVDGFRIDTVKHMDLGASRIFAAAIHEFAQSIGKENFLLVGEITGAARGAYRTLEETGIDAALGIDDIPDKLEYLVKGYARPARVLRPVSQLAARQQGLAHVVHATRSSRCTTTTTRCARATTKPASAPMPSDARSRSTRWLSTRPRSASPASTTAASSASTARVRNDRYHPRGDVRRRLRPVPQPRPPLLRRGWHGLPRACEDPRAAPATHRRCAAGGSTCARSPATARTSACRG